MYTQTPPNQQQLSEIIDTAVQNAFRKFFSELQPQHAEPQSQPEFFNVEETAEFLGYTRSTIYGLVNKGTLLPIKKGHKLRFKRSHLVEWLESGQKKASHQVQSSLGISTRKSSKS